MISRLVASGRYNNSSEVVRAGLPILDAVEGSVAAGSFRVRLGQGDAFFLKDGFRFALPGFRLIRERPIGAAVIFCTTSRRSSS